MKIIISGTDEFFQGNDLVSTINIVEQVQVNPTEWTTENKTVSLRTSFTITGAKDKSSITSQGIFTIVLWIKGRKGFIDVNKEYIKDENG